VSKAFFMFFLYVVLAFSSTKQIFSIMAWLTCENRQQ